MKLDFKLNLFTKVLSIVALAWGAIAIKTEPGFAQSNFSCDLDQISTTVSTERGSIPLIQWTDRLFPPPFTPKERCQLA
jgi:hypothetical protein